MELNESQKEAKRKIIKWYNDPLKKQVFILTGYAGTGKTTIISNIIDELQIKSTTEFVSFTGKAAMVMNLKGVPATTIHKLIYMLDDEDQSALKSNKAKKQKNNLNFVLVDALPNSIKLIVIDEASMISATILRDLLSFGVPVLLIGDPGQLPPIDDDPHILDAPDHHLSDIIRQDKDNPIIKVSQDILEFGRIRNIDYGKGVGVFIGRKLKEESYHAADQILCYRNSTRSDINEMLRKMNGFESPLPMAGDKLICTRNNWSIFVGDKGFTYPLMNGCIGFSETNCVAEKYEDDEDFSTATASWMYGFNLCFRPDFAQRKTILKTFFSPFKDTSFSFSGLIKEDPDLTQFDFGYAITGHKSQGSEFEKVIVIDDIPRNILSDEDIRKWLYTSVTRAKSQLIYVR